MIQSILSRFCYSRDIREHFRAPFSFADHTYATNGYIAVRVPRVEGIQDDAPVKLIKTLTRMFDQAPVRFSPIPHHIRPAMVVCPDCRGHGKMKRCPECDGEGEVWLESDYNTYEATCKTCDGDGDAPARDGKDCGTCCGTRKVHSRDHCVHIGAALIGSALLRLITDLPCAEIQIPSAEMNPVAFRFAGGDGFVMPRRY